MIKKRREEGNLIDGRDEQPYRHDTYLQNSSQNSEQPIYLLPSFNHNLPLTRTLITEQQDNYLTLNQHHLLHTYTLNQNLKRKRKEKGITSFDLLAVRMSLPELLPSSN